MFLYSAESCTRLFLRHKTINEIQSCDRENEGIQKYLGTPANCKPLGPHSGCPTPTPYPNLHRHRLPSTLLLLLSIFGQNDGRPQVRVGRIEGGNSEQAGRDPTATDGPPLSQLLRGRPGKDKKQPADFLCPRLHEQSPLFCKFVLRCNQCHIVDMTLDTPTIGCQKCAKPRPKAPKVETQIHSIAAARMRGRDAQGILARFE